MIKIEFFSFLLSIILDLFYDGTYPCQQGELSKQSIDAKV